MKPCNLITGGVGTVVSKLARGLGLWLGLLCDIQGYLRFRLGLGQTWEKRMDNVMASWLTVERRVYVEVRIFTNLN